MPIIGILLCAGAGYIAGHYAGLPGIMAVLLAEIGMKLCLTQ